MSWASLLVVMGLILQGCAVVLLFVRMLVRMWRMGVRFEALKSAGREARAAAEKPTWTLRAPMRYFMEAALAAGETGRSLDLLEIVLGELDGLKQALKATQEELKKQEGANAELSGTVARLEGEIEPMIERAVQSSFREALIRDFGWEVVAFSWIVLGILLQVTAIVVA